MNPLHRAADFLALKRNTVLLLAVLVVAGTGEKLWLGFAPKYLEVLGAGIYAIGLFDAVLVFLGAVYAYPGGWVTDRFGDRKSLLLFNVISLAGYALVLVWHHWLALVVAAFLFLAWSALSLPATFTVVANSLSASRHTMGIGVQSMVRRIPMMLGPLLGGWLVSRFGWKTGVQFALLGCIGLSLATVLFQWFLADGSPPPAARTASSAISFAQVVRRFSPTLRELLISDILIRFSERLPYTWVVLWVVDHAGLGARELSWLISIEMITAMLCYIPVAHLADKYGRRPFVLVTFVFFTAFPLVLWGAHDFRWLALAFAVRGLKEFGEPARKALILGEPAPELRARSYGAYYLIRDGVVTLGSFLGAALWKLGPAFNFAGAAAFGATGTIWFWWFIYRKPARAL